MFLALISAASTRAAPRRVVGLDVTYRTVGRQAEYRVKDIELDSFRMLVELERALESWGYEVKRLRSLTLGNLLEVDAVVLAKLRDPSWRYGTDEVKAIGDWFSRGGKFLWIGSDSDYVEPYYVAAQGDFKQREPNRVLEVIGSSLRLEFCSVEDVVGAGALGVASRVCAMDTLGGVNAVGHAGIMTRGASKVLFHGPTVLMGFRTGKYVPIEDVFDENTFWLYRTSAEARIVDHDMTRPMAYRVGQKGRFVLAAAQAIRMGDKLSKVIVTGESILGDYNIFSASFGDLALSGPVFVKSAFDWGLTDRTQTTAMTAASAPATETVVTAGVLASLGPITITVATISAIVVVVGLSIWVGKRRQGIRLEQAKSVKSEGPPPAVFQRPPSQSERYEEFLKRLDELKMKGRISERVYARLKDDFEKRLREQKSSE